MCSDKILPLPDTCTLPVGTPMVVMELGQYNALIARIEELVAQNAQLISAIPPEQLEFLNQPLVIREDRAPGETQAFLDTLAEMRRRPENFGPIADPVLPERVPMEEGYVVWLAATLEPTAWLPTPREAEELTDRDTEHYAASAWYFSRGEQAQVIQPLYEAYYTQKHKGTA